MSTKLIIDLMEQLVKINQTFHSFSKEKTACLTKGDTAHLKSLMQKEAVLLKQLERLEKERQRLVRFFLQSKGLVTEAGTLKELLPHVNENEKEKLLSLQQQLTEQIGHLKEQNELNQLLLQDSLRFVNLSLDMLQPEPETGNYGRPDQHEDEPSGRSLFDSKA